MLNPNCWEAAAAEAELRVLRNLARLLLNHTWTLASVNLVLEKIRRKILSFFHSLSLLYLKGFRVEVFERWCMADRIENCWAPTSCHEELTLHLQGKQERNCACSFLFSIQDTYLSLFRNKKFMLDEMTQQNFLSQRVDFKLKMKTRTKLCLLILIFYIRYVYCGGTGTRSLYKK